jgi:hypothetical protein
MFSICNHARNPSEIERFSEGVLDQRNRNFHPTGAPVFVNDFHFKTFLELKTSIQNLT